MTSVPTAADALRLVGLTKAFRSGLFVRRSRPALKGVSFTVPRGVIFGYLGPNGSGKTTTLKIVMGLLARDAGSVEVLGHPLEDRTWRYRAGYLPEHPYFYDYLTPLEYVDYAGRLHGMSPGQRRDRSRELLRTMGLERSQGVPLRRFSKGMLQRVGIAQALVNDPELVFLDEPMSGLDPLGRRLVRDLILDLKRQGKTVFFSTHILSDAETLCDEVAVLRAGELLRVGPLAQILQVDVSHMEVLVTGLSSEAASTLPVSGRQALGERWRLEVQEESVGRVISAVEAAHGRILSVQSVRQSLEDYFVKEMQEQQGAWIVEE